MASIATLSLLLAAALALSCIPLAYSGDAAYAPMTLTVVNNCPFPIWPAIQPNSGHDVLESGGFFLPSLSHRSFPGPDHPWSGRIWARTGCAPGPSPTSPLRCATGDCGGRLQCAGLGGEPPATLAQISLHHAGARPDMSSYGVSVVDGFNVGLSVTPHEGHGNCPVLACRPNLTASCPDELKARAPAAGGGEAVVVGCKSGCEAFKSDELCCRNQYNSAKTCRASKYSEFFKKECHQALTYAHDSPSLAHECAAPKELKVIFCH